MNEPGNSRPPQRVLIWLLALFAISQVVIAWLQYDYSTDERQGVVYGITEFGDYGDQWCPGDIISVSNSAKHLKSPEVFRIVDSIWSVDDRYTVVTDDSPEYIVITERSQPETRVSITIPDIPPGRYEFRHASECTGCDIAYYTVKFSVSEDCGGSQ
jgi:hypothetical protein